MREALGLNPSRRHLLEAIIANGRGGTKRLIRIARLELDPARAQSTAL